MTQKQKAVKEYYLQNPGATIKMACAVLGMSDPAIQSIRRNLIKGGELPRLDPNHIHKRNVALVKECETVGIPVEDVKHGWYKGKHFSLFFKGQEVAMDEVLNQILSEMKRYAPIYPVVKYPKIKDGHLLVVDPADIHIGKLCKAFETGDEYNHKIAIDRVKSGVIGLLQKASSFPVDKILFVVGNDILHTDNAKSTTTAGTFQDSDIMWYEAFITAKRLMIECVEILLTVAPVHIQYDPSNHDYTNGFMLAQTLDAWFHNNKQVTFNISPAHRKYFTYGKNVIGTSHGDGARQADLALLMAHESKDWNDCKHRYFYLHNLHHKISKDYMSVCVEVLRSPSGTDSWHHRNGYQHAPKAVEAFIHHKEHGQVARLTHLF